MALMASSVTAGRGLPTIPSPGRAVAPRPPPDATTLGASVTTLFGADGTSRSRIMICFLRAAWMISSNLSCETMESVSISITPVRLP